MINIMRSHGWLYDENSVCDVFVRNGVILSWLEVFMASKGVKNSDIQKEVSGYFC